MDDLGTLVLSSPRILPLPRTGTFHGGLGDFGSYLTQDTPPRTGTSCGELKDFGYKLTQNTHSPTRTGTSHGGLRDFRSELTLNTLPPNVISHGTILLSLTGGASKWELVFAEVTLSKITHAQSE